MAPYLPQKMSLALASLLSIFCPFSGAFAQTFQQAKSANALINSIGINTHFTYPDTPYLGSFSQAKQKLLELDIRHIRDGVAKDSYKYEPMRDLCDSGIRLHSGVSERVEGYRGALDFDKIDYTLGVVKDFYLGCIESLEGANEYDINNGGEEDWGDTLRRHTETTYNKIKSDPALSDLPVIAPSVAYYNVEQVGDISEWLDYGNLHSYPGGNPPITGLEANIDFTRGLSGTKPYYVTETGYHTATNNDSEVAAGWAQRGVSENAAAKYIPRLVVEYFRRGIVRTYLYEFIDEFPDPQRDNQEDNFGLLRNDLSEKPSYVSLKNTIALLNDSGGASGSGGLSYSLEGDLTDIHQLLLQKQDGSFYLIVWQEVQSYNYATKSDISNNFRKLTLKLENPVDKAETYLPLGGTTSINAYNNVTSIELEVPDHLMIVKLVPDDTTTDSAILIEAESMSLSRYKIEDNSAASGGRLISLRNNDAITDTASSEFSGTSGKYDVFVGYADENDGVANLQINIGGVELDSWQLDKELGANYANKQTLIERKVASGLEIQKGDSIELEGTTNQEEWAQFDYVKFVPVP